MTVDPKTHLQLTLEFIRQHPEEHNQSIWRCDTGMCIAGHLANLHPDVRWILANPDLEDPDTFMVLDETGYRLPVASWARHFLFQNKPENNPDGVVALNDSAALFYAENTVDDLEQLVDAYVADQSMTDVFETMHPDSGQIS